MKDFAKLLVRNRLPVRRNPHEEKGERNRTFDRRDGNSSREKTSDQVEHPGDVYRELDSWRPGVRNPAAGLEVPDMGPADEIMSADEFKQLNRVGRKPVPEKKKRGVCITLSVSPEEAELLRRYAASLDLTFSEWARTVLFSSMKRKLPKRPGNPKE
jgi:hypothetical protein